MLAEISNIQSSDDLLPKKPQKHCDACHYSCRECNGPHEYDCTQCFTETAKRTNQFNQIICLNPAENIPLVVIGTFDGNETQIIQQNVLTKEKQFFYILYMVFIVSITFTIIILIGRNLIAQYCDKNLNLEKKYVYDRIAYDGSKEQEEKITIGNDILSDDSDSEDNI